MRPKFPTLNLSFVICQLSFATKHWSFDIQHLSLVPCHSKLGIRNSTLAILLLLAACSNPAPPSSETPIQPWFQEIALEKGLDFQHVRTLSDNFYFPEIMSGGVGWIDYDGDGWLDLYLVQAGDVEQPHDYTNKLYRNINGQRFEDVTESTNTGHKGYGMGIAVGDIDNDGDSDLYVTNVGPNVLYLNNGDGTFSDVSSAAGVDHNGWGASAAFADFDNDGLLDLYVVNYIRWAPQQELECFSGGAGRDYCHPDNYRSPAPDVLYRNAGNGTFEDVSIISGVGNNSGNGLGVVPGDFNNDQLLDLYVANDGDPNHLWLNNGDNTFSEKGLLSGLAFNRQGTAEAGMGVAIFDLENDGDPDLLLSHLRDETNTLYRNDGGIFQDITSQTGIATPSLPLTGFGTGVHDFNQDGLLDIFVVNGRVGRAGAVENTDPFAEPNQVYRGTGVGKFSFESELLPETQSATSRGAAFADYDNDGDVDVAVVNNGGPVSLLENIADKGGDWIGFSSSAYPGTVVELETSAGTFFNMVQPAGSYQSSNDPRVVFGLGNEITVMSVKIIHPNGTVSNISDFRVSNYNSFSP